MSGVTETALSATRAVHTASSLVDAANTVLGTANAHAKCTATAAFAAQWRDARITLVGDTPPPDRPQRPTKPALLQPADVPRRKINRGTAGRIAQLHALAHIELNAVDLAWDIIARFSGRDLPREFYDDWVLVADEEAKHFGLLADRLSDFDAAYGDLPAHDGLWDSAIETRHDLAARLAVVPLVLEARGLDVTPMMITKLRGVDDEESAAMLEIIYRDEIGHVEIGHRWFEFECGRLGLDALSHWRDLVERHFRGALKPPFNIEARDAAGLPQDWYLTVSET
ncbi:MAG: ferritin-like domain-containing protein [Rhodospirillaceae bacterium]|nr:ferritin-like domain-containing protein [Rhodospirillaceae bacterium]MBT6536386.1 ferritin-like domain-containing protein [Rhodospirillaceae bacterium]MBT7360710.1 ferritin-like domain-containing protein [Rhodospirillaceae bacterium]